jgi:hypothetical protein
LFSVENKAVSFGHLSLEKTYEILAQVSQMDFYFYHDPVFPYSGNRNFVAVPG